ncbi:hypothetical protein [Xenorhabdus nematophila]|nr:hypothetical protein [Xenorhabdus nematophila]
MLDNARIHHGIEEKNQKWRVTRTQPVFILSSRLQPRAESD